MQQIFWVFFSSDVGGSSASRAVILESLVESNFLSFEKTLNSSGERPSSCGSSVVKCWSFGPMERLGVLQLPLEESLFTKDPSSESVRPTRLGIMLIAAKQQRRWQLFRRARCWYVVLLELRGALVELLLFLTSLFQVQS